MPHPQIDLNTLENQTKKVGLELVSFIGREELEKILLASANKLETWQGEGFAGDMAYMKRPKELYSSLDSIMKEAKSVACFAVPYSSEKNTVLKPLHGKIARYAWGKDYHLVLKKRLKELVALLEKDLPGIKTRIFSDAVPILERSLAEACELGFVGKNTMLIRPGLGSYFFIAEILFDCDISNPSDYKAGKSLAVVEDKVGCSTCRSCLDACPTGAFSSPYTLDSKKCISYLTIEKRGLFTEEEASMLGDWIFGCDICQEVCPFNHSSTEELKDFSDAHGVGSSLSLSELFQIKDDKIFNKLFSNTALSRTGREGLLRNASAVLANQKGFEILKDLVEAYKVEPSEILRNSYLQSMKRLKGFAEGADLRLLKANLEGVEE